jgi:hypothetical protein
MKIEVKLIEAGGEVLDFWTGDSRQIYSVAEKTVEMFYKMIDIRSNVHKSIKVSFLCNGVTLKTVCPFSLRHDQQTDTKIVNFFSSRFLNGATGKKAEMLARPFLETMVANKLNSISLCNV